MGRILDANEYFSGKEPSFDGEIAESDLSKVLTWYSNNKKMKDSIKYVCDYLKKKHKFNISSTSSVLKLRGSTFGFVCRIVMRGAVLSESKQKWLDDEIEKIKKEYSEKVEVVEDTTEKKKTPNIQERIKEKSDECIGELEGLFDTLTISKFNNSVSPYSVLHTFQMKTVNAKHIIEWAKHHRNEYDEVLTTDDKELKEGYSNFTKPQLKKCVSFFDQVILDMNQISGESVKTRKPRKRKEKTPEQLVAKINYCQEFKDLGLTSIQPKDIIGTLQLWVYNTKNRKLGVYHAEDAGGFSVKGSAITNFNVKKSVQKTLRKPQVTLPEVLKGGKVYLRTALETIKAVETGLTGRINSDTILLRTIK